MIGYAMLGTNNLAAADAFYAPVLALLGAVRLDAYSNDQHTFYVSAPDKPLFGIGLPYDGKAASVGNGTMVAFAAPTREAINAAHGKALALGGTDEGAPGIRGSDPDGFYAAYFRDLDGNKVCFFRIGPA